jgi:peptidoglycan/LPS O-acetylase OafA/YrhL
MVSMVMKYRAEIDGLRALAVLPVILFHAGFELFSGGYVGVDVFFVISGYLITTILIEDIERDRFSILNFYQRRARRILPALFAMVIVCIIVGWFVLTPYFYRDLFQTTVSISVFASNILLFLKSGYFTTVSELKPFLHTWSLAVEEQYYLVFPIFLIFVWRLGRSRVLWIIIILAFISLLMSEWGWRNNPSGNFYLAHTRAWELFAGSITAFIVDRDGVRKNNALAFTGLAAIIFSIFAYDESTPFPSIYALAPVLGVVLLILYADKSTIAAKILSTKLLVSIGLISYSAYLWHHPVFAFMRHLTLFELTGLHYVIAMLIIFSLSILSWRFIERPFRDKNLVSTKIVLISSVSALITMGVIGFLGHVKLGFPERFSLETQQIAKGSFDKNPRQNDCFYLAKLDSINSACILGDVNIKNPNIALIGDSHGDMFAHSLSDALHQKGLAAYNLTFLGCKPVNFIENKITYTENHCFKSISKFLSDHEEVNTVIVSFRWTSAIKGVEFGNEAPYPGVKFLTEPIIKSRGEIFTRKIEKLVGSERTLILVYPVPEADVDVPNFTVKYRIILDDDFTLRVPYSAYIARNKEIYSALDAINVGENIARIYPSKLLCENSPNGFCETVMNGYSVYYDDNHLSNYGASLITPGIVAIISD